MFYTVYKITNKIDGNIYIGAHETTNLDDSYMGSGKYLKRAQEKHGIENFEKEILEVFDNQTDMFVKEKELVDNVFVKRIDTYNIKEGGKNWDYEHALKGRIIANANGALELAKESLRKLRQDSVWMDNYTNAIKGGLQNFYENGGKGSFSGKNHSDEARRKIGETTSKAQKGEGNSQFGTVWVTNIGQRKSYRVNKNDLNNELNKEGVSKGRIKDFDLYFEKIENRKIKNQEKEKDFDEKRKIAQNFLKIQSDNNIKSTRRLHAYLKEKQLYDFSAEALRLFIKKHTI